MTNENKRIGNDMALRRTALLGKLTAEVKVRVDEETKEELDRLANEAGMGLTEFVRELLMVRAYGHDHVCRLHKRRLEMVAGVKLDEGQ
jgi:hypothetical protein